MSAIRAPTYPAEEERDVVPLIATHITQGEWEHLGKVSFSKFKPYQRFTARARCSRRQARKRQLAGLPPPIRIIWQPFGQRKYQRFMGAVRG